jgi:hypothetical protein
MVLLRHTEHDSGNRGALEYCDVSEGTSIRSNYGRLTPTRGATDNCSSNGKCANGTSDGKLSHVGFRRLQYLLDATGHRLTLGVDGKTPEEGAKESCESRDLTGDGRICLSFLDTRLVPAASNPLQGSTKGGHRFVSPLSGILGGVPIGLLTVVCPSPV